MQFFYDLFYLDEMLCVRLPAYNFGSCRPYKKVIKIYKIMNLENGFFADVISKIVQIAKNCSDFFLLNSQKKNLSI